MKFRKNATLRIPTNKTFTDFASKDMTPKKSKKKYWKYNNFRNNKYLKKYLGLTI